MQRTVVHKIRRWINQRVRNAVDRTFLKVTVNSKERILVSHDFQDFPERIRAACPGELGVTILEASEAEARVNHESATGDS